MQAYDLFLESKVKKYEESGFAVEYVNSMLFDFQADIVKWCLKKGKAAIFAGTGLGKTGMQLEWAKKVSEYTNGDVLILAPLAVSEQTVREGEKFGVIINICRSQEDIKHGINITNYEMLHKFNCSSFSGVILDESSILKSFTGKVRTEIIEAFRNTPYRLACTATPSPNDYMELGNHAEFLGVMTRSEMLSMYFVHNGGETSKWRLKGHCIQTFWDWVSSWSVMLSNPTDLGYENHFFDLPKLTIHEVIVDEEYPYSNMAKTLSERREARRATLELRTSKAAEIANSLNEPVILWCDLNDESKELTNKITGAVEIKGSHKNEYKKDKLMGFAKGEYQKLVTKPSIAGFGMNWQHCSKMIFTGLSDSFEQYYQAVRRCWRAGQTKDVDVWIVTSKREGAVVENIKRKEALFDEMLNGMIAATQDIAKENIKATKREEAIYKIDYQNGQDWEMYLGDNVELITQLPDDSIHYTLFSPPFSQLYVYSNSIRDMGNCANDSIFFSHFSFLANELLRVTMPGRLVSIHCMLLPSMKERDGVIGLKDFRGDLIRVMLNQGFIYHSEVQIWKNPVTEMQRTKALGLLHKQIRKDSTMCRMGIPDYIITFRKPGENPEPVSHTHENFPVSKWQQYASPVWMDIKQSNTLQRRSAREEADEKHICPLQLDVIERCIELWTNKGDIVFDPFAGIGSVPWRAVQMDRRGIGFELKESYYKLAVKNMEMAQESKLEPKQISIEEAITRPIQTELGGF
ncbi:MAG: DNA methyltransferase [Proteiniphilum sp.]|nr:DNA methyltransferase [Proteiniphilum sp.]MDD3077404.1 DNA methyltransferase [Proteiniphilum sp.]MDD3957228.1 DNA methyltransferase [Proteiniphilum sp.]MDD4453660.1 DNA methyltransferase [Proteiniphilum sp.]